MLKQLIVSAGLLGAVLPAAAADQPQVTSSTGRTGVRQFEISYTNLTRGQVFSPSAFASHTPNAPDFFKIGTPASFSLQRMAEEGNNGPTYSGVVIPQIGSVYFSASSALTVLPGQTRKLVIEATPAFPEVSGYFMLVRTNDGFTGINRVNVLTLSGPTTYDLFANDAGTERNNERQPWLVDEQGSRRDPEGSVVRRHPGLRSIAQDPTSNIPPLWVFDPAAPVGRLTIKPL